MDTAKHRWALSAAWVATVLALGAAGSQGALGTGAAWALPAALAGTVVAVGWPNWPGARLAGWLALAWQLALIGAYWPFAAVSLGGPAGGPWALPPHALAIGAVLLALALSFVALFVGPALALASRLSRADAVATRERDARSPALAALFKGDAGLQAALQSWQQQLRTASGGVAVSRESARSFFDLHALTHARLRLDLFQNLPGVFTGIGIIGTFSGLILGLRSFRIAQDPAVVQKSLELLLAGVWEAFLVSALAIALAIAVTLAEKLLMASLARRAEALAIGLDRLCPPQAAAADGADRWAPQLLQALRQAPASASALAAAPAASDTTQQTTEQVVQQTAAQTAALTALADGNRQASAALAELARALPAQLSTHLATHLQGATLAQHQATQSLKALSMRLENVAAGIEASGRKTLETVAARLMQSEMNMVSRNHAVAEHLGELVQRIEALCGLLQQDRLGPAADAWPGEAPQPTAAVLPGLAPLPELTRAALAAERMPPRSPADVSLSPLPSSRRSRRANGRGLEESFGS
jgi:hypothetical protein